MILQLDAPEIAEVSVEIGYGLLYIVLMGFVLRKYRKSGYQLALYFGIAFLCLGISGLYGGVASLLDKSGFGYIPIFGSKILEIYIGLSLASLVFFFIGLLRLR